MGLDFRENLLYHIEDKPEDNHLCNGPLYLEYQRLNDLGDKLEEQGCCEEVEKMLEIIGERQIEILNQVMIN